MLPEKALPKKALPEKALIRHIRQLAGQKGGIIGIGDDCASLAIPVGEEVLVTTDFSLEGVHFRRDWQPAASIGHRCLLRGLSDIAAMGGTPRGAFLSWALPRGISDFWVRSFLKGLLALAKNRGIPLAGGDTAESAGTGKVLADIVVVGSVPRGEAVPRSGARPGDRIFITGTLGGAGHVLNLLSKGRRKDIAASELSRYLYPESRVNVGLAIRRKSLASSMIDVSDGLSTDLWHICEESGVGAEIIVDALPRATLARRRQLVALDLALHAGDAYELLFTARDGKRVPSKLAGVPVTEIGQIVRGRNVLLKMGGKTQKLRPQGWEHLG